MSRESVEAFFKNRFSDWHVTYACRDGHVLRGYMVKGDIFKIEEFGLGA